MYPVLSAVLFVGGLSGLLLGFVFNKPEVCGAGHFFAVFGVVGIADVSCRECEQGY